MNEKLLAPWGSLWDYAKELHPEEASYAEKAIKTREKAADPPTIAVQEAIRSDIALYAGGTTWVDRDYDEKLGEALGQADAVLENSLAVIAAAVATAAGSREIEIRDPTGMLPASFFEVVNVDNAHAEIRGELLMRLGSSWEVRRLVTESPPDAKPIPPVEAPPAKRENGAGNTPYDDDALTARVLAAFDTGQHKSIRAASVAISDEIPGGGTRESKARRIADKARTKKRARRSTQLSGS